MKSMLRLFSFVWPYRRWLALSVVFALGIAVLWTATIGMTYPVMFVMSQEEGLKVGVENAIADTEAEVERFHARLDDGNARHQARLHGKIGKAQWKLYGLRFLQEHIMPYVPDDRFQTMTLLLVILVIATLLRGVCRFAQETLVGSVVELAVMDLRKQCYRRVLALDYQTIALDGPADIMSRFTYDMTHVSNGIKIVFVKVIREPFKAVGCIMGALFINWQLTTLSLLLVPLGAFMFDKLGRKLKSAGKRMMESMSQIYKVLEETLEGLKVVIAFDGARQQRRRFHERNKEYYQKALRIVQLDALSSPLIEVLGTMAIFLAVLPGTYLVCRGVREIWGITLAPSRMDHLQLIAMYMMLVAILDPLRKLSSIFPKLKRSEAAATRMFELMDRQPRIQQLAGAPPMERHSESIEFDGVTFAYSVREADALREPALRDVTLKVEAGDFVAFVGENGSGKSTLVSLLPRFFDPDRGAVLIDGKDMRECNLRDLRRQIGLVTQETTLFDDTILENLRYGLPSATLEEVREAAEKAGVLDVIESLPEGFETGVGEKGRQLSGGQRQRLALARAMLRDPAILILDEPTSAVDAQSELVFYKTLKDFARGRTTMMVTHFVSPQLLEMITKVAVMDRGQLIGYGKHDDLMNTCPLYQRLFQARGGSRAA